MGTPQKFLTRRDILASGCAAVLLPVLPAVTMARRSVTVEVRTLKRDPRANADPLKVAINRRTQSGLLSQKILKGEDGFLLIEEWQNAERFFTGGFVRQLL